jgi:DNA-binding XRE family transcriptional regulator
MTNPDIAPNLAAWHARPSCKAKEDGSMTIIDNNAIALRLAQLRWRLQIDQREAARRAGVSQKSWCRWERGFPFRTGAMIKICLAFKCSSDWLICGEDNR